MQALNMRADRSGKSNHRAAKIRVTMGVVLVLALLVFISDPPRYPAGHFSGVIVATFPPGKQHTGSARVQVKLEDGRLVTASMLVLEGFPYPDGTNVIVSAVDSLVFRFRTYEARVGPNAGK